MHRWHITRIVLDIFILNRNFITCNLNKELRFKLESNEKILKIEAQNIMSVRINSHINVGLGRAIKLYFFFRFEDQIYEAYF